MDSDVGDAPPAPLPEGLTRCTECGEVRGRTPGGRRSSCLCQGIECIWCGARFRRPISDHYVPETKRWLHTPYLALPAGHRCPPGVVRGTGRWYRLLAIEEGGTVMAEASDSGRRGTFPGAPSDAQQGNHRD